MKSIIRILLKERLEEVSLDKKETFGSGMEHNVYASRQHPDRLYKMGREYMVNSWIKIFIENPKIFPKVYRVIKSKRYSDTLIVEIEKLEIRQAEKDFKLVRDILSNFSRYEYNQEIRLQSIYILDSWGVKFVEFIKKFKEWLIKQKYNNPTIELCLKWTKMIYNIYGFLVNKYDYHERDLHAKNVAYDKAGNIKIIDI